MFDIAGNELNVGDLVWFIPTPVRNNHQLEKAKIIKINKLTVTLEFAWWDSIYSTQKYDREFNRKSNQILKVTYG